MSLNTLVDYISKSQITSEQVQKNFKKINITLFFLLKSY